jgi:rod shape-determining protein MreD
MSRGVVSAIAVALLLFVLRHSMFVDFTVFGVHPELLLLFAVCCGLAGGPNYGVVAGFLSGLASDAFLTSPLGLSAFAFAVAGYAAGVAADDTTSTPGVTALTAAATSAIGLLLVIVIGGMFGELDLTFRHAAAVVFFGSLVNAVLALPVRRMLRDIRRSERELAW